MGIRILAAFEPEGDKVGCGWRECDTALEAVMQELREAPADTVDATEIGAVDDWMAVSAYKNGIGYEVHIQIGGSDVFFAYER